MALQSSGQISMGDINVELGRTRTAIISLDTAENGGYVTINARSTNKPSATNPATISEWYSYNHSGVTDTTPPTVPGTLTATNTVSSVTLDWGASTDNNLITYEVFRNDVFYVETSNLSYFDNTGDMIVRSYKIRARDSSNYSGFGNVVSKGGSGGVN
jgi:hypothetical protein